ncbi:MAG: hypothetical protein AAF806_25860 [Bacteroidota bacterium]
MSSQPSIYVGQLRVDEPVTMITDLVITVVCFYAFYSLSKQQNELSKAQNFLRYYFLMMGFATMIGGVFGHGFLYYFGLNWKLPGWLTSMFAVTLIERASIEQTKPIVNPKVGKIMGVANIIELVTFVSLTFVTLFFRLLDPRDSFRFVEIHTAYGLLLIVLPLQAYVYLKTRNPGSKLFLIGIGFVILTAFIYYFQLAFSPWFNQHDMSHLFIALASWLFYKGTLRLSDGYQFELNQQSSFQ